MVIKPEDLEMLSNEEKETVEKIEGYIDDELQKRDPADSRFSIVLSGFKLPEPKVQRELKRKYKEAGWREMTFESSQRDGVDYIVLQK